MGIKILVVDDSSTIRAMESFILKSAGFEPEPAANGIEALEKIYRGKYDLVIADINMPKMDGLTMVRTLREQPEYSDLPIIILSSESEEPDRVKGIAAGANVYLVKPTEPAKLVQNVKMLLSEA